MTQTLIFKLLTKCLEIQLTQKDDSRIFTSELDTTE